jgi:hypothetical protein
MSEPAGVRVRPPRPLSRPVRAGLAAGVALLVLGGYAVLQGAVSSDRHRRVELGSVDHPLPPSGSRIDRFDADGPLGSTPGFGRWRVVAGEWSASGGFARPRDVGRSVALVDAGGTAVLIDALVAQPEPGSGLVLADADGDRLELVVAASGRGWELDRITGGVRGIVQAVPGATRTAVVQVVRQGAELRITIDRTATAVTLATPASGTRIGIIGAAGRTAFERFAYLRLAEGP